MSKHSRTNAHTHTSQYTAPEEQLEVMINRMLHHMEKAIEDLATMWNDIRARPEVKMSQKMCVHRTLISTCVLATRALKAWQKKRPMLKATPPAPTITPPSPMTGMDLGALLNPNTLGIRNCLSKNSKPNGDLVLMNRT